MVEDVTLLLPLLVCIFRTRDQISPCQAQQHLASSNLRLRIRALESETISYYLVPFHFQDSPYQTMAKKGRGKSPYMVNERPPYFRVGRIRTRVPSEADAFVA